MTRRHPMCIALAALLGALAARADLVQTGRAISLVETNRVGFAIVSVRLAFAPTATETNTLFMAYGEADRGDDIDAWDHVDLLGVVPPETNVWTCAMPHGWGETSLNARFFFARGVALPYDYEVEYLESDGNQYVKLPKLTFTSLRTRFVKTEPHGRRVALAGTGAYHWYDVKDTGAFTGGGTCPVDTVFDFASTNSDVWIDGVRRGSFATQGDRKYNLHNGIEALMIGSFGIAGNFFKGRIHAVRMWKDDLPVLNALPCVTNGVACFYDSVSRVFIRNAGTGAYAPGPQAGYTRDQETRVPVSSSATLNAGLSLIVDTLLDIPANMVPAPGSYAVTAATACTSPATYEADGVRYTCQGYTLETFRDGAWTPAGTFGNLSFDCPADGVLRRLTWNWTLTHYRIDVSASPAENGAIAISPPSPDGYFPIGTALTLTPVPAEGRTHLGWYVVQDKEVLPTLTYTLTTAHPEGPLSLVPDCPQTVTGYFAGRWTYDDSNSRDRRIYNGVWNLTVAVSSSPAGLLLTKWNAGHGRLDFTDFEADTGLKIVGTGSPLFFKQAYNKGPTSLHAPDFEIASERAFQYCYRMTDIVLSPDLSTVGVCTFYEARSLTNFQPRVCSKLTSVGQMAFKLNSKMTGDFSFPALTSLASTESFVSTAITGVRLPACATIADYSFNGCTALTNVVAAATSIGKNAFNNCPALRNVELTAKTAVSFVTGAFPSLTSNADIWYFGKSAPASLPAQSLYTGSKTAFPRLHVRHGNDAEGWKALCTRVKDPGTGQTAITADDLARADYPGKRTIGFVNNTNNRVWILADPLDAATILTLR